MLDPFGTNGSSSLSNNLCLRFFFLCIVKIQIEAIIRFAKVKIDFPFIDNEYPIVVITIETIEKIISSKLTTSKNEIKLFLNELVNNRHA